MNKRNTVYELYDQDIIVILFDQIFEKVQVQVLNSIQPIFNNNDICFSLDVKRYFLHFLIKESCEYFRNISGINKILLIDNGFTKLPYEIWNYLDKKIVAKFIFNCFNTLKNRYPFPIYITKTIIEMDTSGETQDCIHNMVHIVNKFKEDNINTKKLKEYTLQNGLNFLTNTYLPSTEFKKLLYNS